MRSGSRWSASLALAGGLLSGGACHPHAGSGAGTPADSVAADSSAPRPTSAASQTSSSSAMERDEIRSRHALRVDELLAGQPGVQVSHTPQGGISVRIRGSGTINGSGEPLFVIDGNTVGIGDDGVLRNLTPVDVVRVEVLRDAASTAIYGSRGANGVIVITTRRPR